MSFMPQQRPMQVPPWMTVFNPHSTGVSQGLSGYETLMRLLAQQQGMGGFNRPQFGNGNALSVGSPLFQAIMGMMPR